MNWILKRDNFKKIEEFIMAILGLSLFLDYSYTKALVPVVILIIILRKKAFGERLDCGSEKLKKYIIYYIFIGIIWNFLGAMNYKAPRSFLKMGRYISFLFFLYPLFKEKKESLKKFLGCSFVSFCILFYIVVQQYKEGIVRVTGFEGVNSTGTIGAIMAVFSFGMIIEENKLCKRIFYLIPFLMGVFIPIATKGRAPLVGIAMGMGVIIAIDIYKKVDLKKIISTLLGVLLIGMLGLRYIPEKNLSRFINIFNTEKTISNTSNGLRLEMWKNAMWRIEQKPIFGSGTKFDNGLFEKYVKNMPEITDVERKFKLDLLNGGFNDAHSMYLNAIVDNGLFAVSIFGFWFIIPIHLLCRNYKKLKKTQYILASIGGMSVYLTVGAFWMLWRTPEQMYFWILFTMFLSEIYRENSEEEKNVQR